MKSYRSTLKPCPFCGSEPVYGDSKTAAYIECGKCQQAFVAKNTYREAQEAWNTRAPTETTAYQPEDGELLRYGYAPGGYSCICIKCDQEFGPADKRCRVCRPCAVKSYFKAGAPVEPGECDYDHEEMQKNRRRFCFNCGIPLTKGETL